MCASSQLQRQFINQLRDSDVLCKPERRRYYLGEKVTADIHGLDGRCHHTTRFTITHSPGSGFAGQVYCAQPEDGSNPVAIKVLRPVARWREQFRDALFRLSFQAVFAPRLREEAVRAGLIWQTLLRLGAEIEWGSATAITHPLGYYWDDELGSFAEIHEWINGRIARSSPDEWLACRLFGRSAPVPDCEMRRQRRFMANLSQLCYQMGAIGLARQYEWYTFVSQANVLRRFEPVAAQSEFVGVDFRPGLAVPFFLPLSPHHARIIARGLRRGVMAHFDEVDLNQLDKYVARHPNKFEPLAHLIKQLKKEEATYRAGLPDLLSRPAHLRQPEVRMAMTTSWRKLNLISEGKAQQLIEKPLKFYLYFLLDQLSFMGHFLMRCQGNCVYRWHLGRILRDRVYRQEVTAVICARDMVEWQEEGRVDTALLPALAQSSPRYWRHKLFLSWLPVSLHRLLTDPAARHRWLNYRFLHPMRLLLRPEQRQSWLRHIIAEQVKNGVVSEGEESGLLDQITQPHMNGFLRDLGLVIGLDVFAKILYLVLGFYGIVQGKYLPFLVASFGPFSPSGLVRASYVLLQLIGNLPAILRRRDGKLLLARLLGIVIAPWRIFGNLFISVEMFAYYPQMSALLADYLVAKLVNNIPVLGGRGKLLAYWAFQLTYNLPLSIRRSLLGSFQMIIR